MKRDEREQDQTTDVLVIGRRQAYRCVGDEAGQGTGKRDFVIADQPAAHLRGQKGQHGKHRECAQGVVARRVFRATLSGWLSKYMLTPDRAC